MNEPNVIDAAAVGGKIATEKPLTESRAKITNDPNNTNWSRSTTNFGHKILTSQGWTPGDLLGVKNAPHAELHTKANSSHIRVALKDDNLGLGAKRGSGQAAGECTGLDVFQGLLGRLNGKSDVDLEKEQRSREDLKRAIYTERRWGSVRFVKGGLLVGDKIQDLLEHEADRLARLAKEQPGKSETGTTRSSKIEETCFRKKDRKSKKKRKALELSERGPFEDVGNVDEALDVGNKDVSFRVEDPGIAMNSLGSDDADSNLLHQKAEKRRRKEERHQRRTQRHLRKEQRRRTEHSNEHGDTEISSANSEEIDEASGDTLGKSEVVTLSDLRPAPILNGRHALRQRYIQQKKMASMDSKALNEVSQADISVGKSHD
ncbi:MAG: telomerase inhibitor [Pycnora praestabilis]|nr:MAG: telomerase inhibitor [Pycnora praestabilis]